MTEIDALVFKFIDRHKTVIKAFKEGKLEDYIDSLCHSCYGCACGDFHMMSSSKGIMFQGARDTEEHLLTKKEVCRRVRMFLGSEV